MATLGVGVLGSYWSFGQSHEWVASTARWLRFGSDTAAVRFEQGVELADRTKPALRVVGPPGAVVETSVELLRRTDPFALCASTAPV